MDVDSRKIIHIDMDCFYAAVEIKYQPRLKGKPLAVGGSPDGRGGVLTTANYEARQFGVKSAMTSNQALRLCPDLILVPPDFSKYKAESAKVRQILNRYSLLVEPLSLDEAYLDVTAVTVESGSATRIAQRIRKEIREELHLTASAGVAPNKFLAKIASDLNKPDGIAVIRPQDIERFVHQLPVEKIWGVGKVTAEKLKRKGLLTCGDLRRLSLAALVDEFGSWGSQLYDFSRGIDNRPVVIERERKSLTVEETYGHDLESRLEVLSQLPALYADFSERLLKYRSRGEFEASQLARSAVVKLKFNNFRSKGRERQWNSAATPSLEMFREITEEALDGETLPVRLIGLGVRLAGNAKDKKSAHDADGLQLKF